MDIGTKSIGFLIDQLITTSMRCWVAQDEIMDESLSENERLVAAISAQLNNAQRTELMREIDSRFEGRDMPLLDKKTYFKDK